jgi:hypothetical protein
MHIDDVEMFGLRYKIPKMGKVQVQNAALWLITSTLLILGNGPLSSENYLRGRTWTLFLDKQSPWPEEGHSTLPDAGAEV